MGQPPDLSPAKPGRLRNALWGTHLALVSLVSVIGVAVVPAESELMAGTLRLR